MNKPGVITIIGLSAVVGLAAACSSTANNTVTTNTKPAAANTAATATASNTSSANGSHNTAGDDTPAAVKAAFPDAQSFTTQHKDISAKTSEIEKSAGVKPTETDHHSYLAFSSAGGTRRQIGAATVVKADGKDIVIVYESKGGMPTVKEVRAEGVPAPFLAQFAGKDHDAKIQLGADIKANGADEKTAKAITDAIRLDVQTMQALYGSSHSH